MGAVITNCRQYITGLLCAWLLLCSGLVPAVHAGEEPILAVIVNGSVSDAALSEQEVRNAFLGRKTFWSDGNALTIVLIEDKAIHEAFLKRYVHKTPSRYRIFWKELAFTGKGAPPLTLHDEAAVIHYVHVTPGAVGYVTQETALAVGCKILAIHGKGEHP